MVTSAFFLLAVSLAPASPFVLPIKGTFPEKGSFGSENSSPGLPMIHAYLEKDDGILNVEDISLAGTKNHDIIEKLTQALKNSFSDVVDELDSEEEHKKSVEVAISVANIKKKDDDDDTNDMKDKSIPGKHNECAEGMIFLSELDICVPYNPSPPLPPKTMNIYDIPQGDAPIHSPDFVSALKYGQHDKDHGCDDDEIYLSELDICAPARPAKPLPPKPRASSIYDIPQGDAPAQLNDAEDDDSHERNDNKKPGDGPHGCAEGEIYLSELDICAPHTGTAPLPPRPRVQSIFDIPQGDAPQADSFLAETELQPRRKKNKKGNKNKAKPLCGKGELYLSELDICVPYNNCYPYGNTC